MKLDETYVNEINLSRENTFNNEIIIVDGQARSGKNLISVLLSAMNKVEKMRLDSQIDYIPRYYFLGKMTLDAAVTALRTEFDEKFYYNAISRDVNFRLSDYSGVMKQGNRFEYFKRLFQSADDAAYKRIATAKHIFQEMTHDGLHVASLYFAALGNRLKMIHVYRDPSGNIYEQNNRGMGERIGVDPRELQLTFLWNGRAVPIMAIGREDEYLTGNSTERLVVLVDAMYRLNIQGYNDLSELEKSKILFIDFDSFVVEPYLYMNHLENFIGKEFSSAAPRILRREKCPRKIDPSLRQKNRDEILKKLSGGYKSTFIKLFEDYDLNDGFKKIIKTDNYNKHDCS